MDDILAVNVDISDMISTGYPTELVINKESDDTNIIKYLDMQLDLQNNSIKPYNKIDVFKFHVIRAYHDSSCVNKRMIIGVIMGNILRFARITTNLKDFIEETGKYITILLNRNHDKKAIMEAIVTFCAKHHTILWKYKLIDKKRITRELIKPISFMMK